MKCPYCGQETPDDSTFCAECGERLDDMPLDPSLDLPEDPDERKPRRKKKTPLLIAAGAAFLVLAISGAVFFSVRTPEKDSSGGQTAEAEKPAGDDTEAEDGAAPETEEDIDPSDADFNLTTGGQLRLDGYIRSAAGNQKLLRWDDGLSFYGRNPDGTEILLEDIDSASIDDSLLPDGMLDELSSNQKVRVDGQMYIDSGELYIMPYEISDGDGRDLIAAYEKSQSEPEDDSSSTDTAAGGYILPQSSARLLTESDLSGLSLQEVNYAKNEIYARHGRMFNSRELQDYFNSQSWYSGTVSPEAFSESVLSDVEKQNAQFLSNAEYAMDPNGYQLDAN